MRRRRVRERRGGGRESEYVSQDPGLVVLPPGLSSSAFTFWQFGAFRRQNVRVEARFCDGRHRNGKIPATDPASCGVFCVIFVLFV